MDAGISGIVLMDNIVDNSVIQPDNAKTRQATRYGVRLFREYCIQHGVDTINNLPPREIARMLKGFYGQARTKDGQRFSVNSLIAIRYAISRYYRSPMVHRKIDIVKDTAFNEANETFRAVLKDLERESRGTACQKELQMVDMDDRRKLRHYFEHAISTPRGLLQKVWYDLMLRVGRRGRESQRLLNRNSFRIAKTSDGRQYIYQVDDEEAGIILEIPGDPLCPVKTLKFYLTRLNPACRALFQRPKEHIYEQDTCWYVNSPVGKNMLATMMSTISKCARLSRVYTNVRIRATTYSPADGKGCIPCPDLPDSPKTPEIESLKVLRRKIEIRPKPVVNVSQNSHIIKQLNAPIVQACLAVAVSSSQSSVSSSVTPVISNVFPVALTPATPSGLLNGTSETNHKDKVQHASNCFWCKKELNLRGGIILKSNEDGKEFCSTECLGLQKWLSSDHKQDLAVSTRTVNCEKNGTNNSTSTTHNIQLPPNPKIQKLLTLCSTANLLIPLPSICKDFTAPDISVPEIEEIIENGDENKSDSRSTSPLLIVPDEVFPEAILETVDSETEAQESGTEMEYEESYKLSTCDQEVMCQPSTTSLAISCKPILKHVAIQTDFSTYFSDSFSSDIFYPKYSVNSSCCSIKKEQSDADEIEEHPAINGEGFESFEDTQDTSSLWMSVEESDEDDDADLPHPPELAKCEDSFITEPLANYSHRGRTTKRTTWDEIAQRSKLQTLWGVKVFREWLQSRGSHRDFEQLEATHLANILEEFYENLTKPDGEEYSVSTMHTIRASISRYLTLPPQSKPFSIIRDREFKRANEAFYRRIRRLQNPRHQVAPPPPPPAFHHHYGGARTAIWQPQPSGTINIPCSSNGSIMLVQLGPH